MWQQPIQVGTIWWRGGGEEGPRNGGTYKCHHISAPLYGQTPLHRNLWSLACHGKTLKAEHFFWSHINLLCISINRIFINILQNLTFEYLFIAYNEYGAVVQVSGGSWRIICWQRHKILFARNVVDSLRNCEILVKEYSATLPVFIQPGGFSTSPHVGYNSTEKLNDWFLNQLGRVQSFNKSVTILLSCSLVNSEALRSIDEDRVYGTNKTGAHLKLGQI